MSYDIKNMLLEITDNDVKNMCLYDKQLPITNSIKVADIIAKFNEETNCSNKKYIYFSIALIKFEKNNKTLSVAPATQNTRSSTSASSSSIGGNNTKNNFNFKHINNIVLNNTIPSGGDVSYFSETDLTSMSEFIKNSDNPSITYDANIVEKINYNPIDNDKIRLINKQHNLYNFKRFFKGLTTELFMKALKESNNYDISTFVYISINLGISNLIYLINKIYQLNIDNDSIYIIYKGGNTVKNHYAVFYEKCPPNIKANLNIDEFKIGDWDYSLYINFKKLRYNLSSNPNLPLDNFIKMLTNTIQYVLNYIKINLESLIKDETYIKFGELLNKNINDIDITLPQIKSYCDRSFNIDSKDYVSNFKIDSIRYKNGSITCPASNVCTNENIQNNDLVKKSYLVEIKKEDTTETNRARDHYKYKIKTQVTKPFYTDDDKKQSHIYIVGIDSIKHLTFKNNYINFYLFRLKLAVTMNYTEETTTNGVKTIKTSSYDIPIELIDLSYGKENDTKCRLSNETLAQFQINSDQYVTSYALKFFSSTLKVDMPSLDYMFVDIYTILAMETIFPWYDKKYIKRFKRLILIFVMSSVQKFFVSGSIDYVEDKLNTILSFINKLKNKEAIEVYKWFIHLSNIPSIQFIPKVLIEGDINTLSVQKLDINVCGDAYLNAILTNIYESALFLSYMDDKNNTAIRATDKMYCELHFNKYIECDVGDACEDFIITLYSFDELKKSNDDNKNEFKVYVNNLSEICSTLCTNLKGINRGYELFGKLKLQEI